MMARGSLDALFDALMRRGFRLVRTTVRDGAIAGDGITSFADLPAGWTDEQDGGFYRLRRR
jgi:sulfhydrogenase subunit beta (sulfur reductase)